MGEACWVYLMEIKIELNFDFVPEDQHHPKFFKVGISKNPRERMKSIPQEVKSFLGSTCLVHRIGTKTIEAYLASCRWHASSDERLIHAALAEDRAPFGREYFRVDAAPQAVFLGFERSYLKNGKPMSWVLEREGFDCLKERAGS